MERRTSSRIIMAKVGTLETQIVTGECPECSTNTLLVSWSSHIYRCVNCGHDLEQKVNGVIKYVIADRDTQLTARNLDDDHG